MIVTTILGNLHDDAGRALVGARQIDPVDLPSTELVKRVNRLTTRAGRVLGLRLPGGSPDLLDGDVLALDVDGEGSEPVAVVVSVATTDVLVISPGNLRDALFVAHSLGNRHLQAQFPSGEDAGSMVVAYDHTVENFLDHHHVPYRREERVLEVPFRHTEHTH